MIENQPTSFEIIGEKTLHRLVDTFYDLAAQHPMIHNKKIKKPVNISE